MSLTRAALASTLKRKTRDALAYRRLSTNGGVLLRWWRHKNWGDALSPVLASRISGRPAVHSDAVLNLVHDPVYSLTGSILEHPMAGRSRDHVIWGSGFMYPDGTLQGVPGQICAVRGPLSRGRCIAQGIDCPPVYGDPALLFPRFYWPQISPIHELGIVPHFRDADAEWLKRLNNESEVVVIDVTSGVEAFVNSLLSCRSIASSSLHGLIAADAYGIPSVWIQLNRADPAGGFKFRDYFESVRRPDVGPVPVTVNTSMTKLVDNLHLDGIDIDLERLLAVCPLPRSPNSSPHT